MYNVQRWTGSAWYSSMCSPYKSYTEAMNHVKKYWWHYNEEYPYRIVEDKVKPKLKISTRFTNNEGYVIVNKVM